MIMRTEHEIMDLLLNVAKADERIRAVSLEGSRANPTAPKDNYRIKKLFVIKKIYIRR
jgi:aminoglycoside 6-adenylyltransferase